jgi:membrane-associated protein
MVTGAWVYHPEFTIQMLILQVESKVLAQSFSHTFMLFLDTEALVRYGGLLAIFIIVFCNIGIFFCFFVPTGAVLFTTGVLVAAGSLDYDVTLVVVMLIFASILGGIAGYATGYTAGPYLYKKKDTRFYKKKYLLATEQFYNKHGKLALTAGFFLPVIRSFAPVVAGVFRLPFRYFLLFASIGSAIWVSSFVMAGYFLGSRPFLRPWLKFIVAGFIILVTVPLVIKVAKEMSSKKNKGI